MDDDNNILSNEDIEMLNSATVVDSATDLSGSQTAIGTSQPQMSRGMSSKTGGPSSPMLDSNGGSDSIEDSATTTTNNTTEGGGLDEEDENFLLETETKTPGEILEEFCSKLDDINTTLPENVVNYYMKKTGFIVNDPKLVKLVSIASQKFISEIVNDVMQHHKLRSKTTATTTTPANASGSATNAAAAAPSASASNTAATSAAPSTSTASTATTAASAKGAKSAAAANPSGALTLTLEDLTHVLSEYGINVKKPYYFM